MCKRMKVSSLNFREKIIDVYFTEGLSQRKLAQRFRVSLSFVETLLKRLRETEDILPKPHGGGYPPKLNSEQLALTGSIAALQVLDSMDGGKLPVGVV